MRKAGKTSGMYMLKNMLFMLEFIRRKIFFGLCLAFTLMATAATEGNKKK